MYKHVHVYSWIIAICVYVLVLCSRKVAIFSPRFEGLANKMMSHKAMYFSRISPIPTTSHKEFDDIIVIINLCY